MTISITFTAASRVALDAALRDFLGEPGQATTPQTPAPKASKAKADPQPSAAESASVEPAESPSAATSETAAQAAETSSATATAGSSDEAIPYPVISKTITDAVTRAGKPAVVALLGKYGAANGKELKAEQYAAFKAEAEAL